MAIKASFLIKLIAVTENLWVGACVAFQLDSSICPATNKLKSRYE